MNNMKNNKFYLLTALALIIGFSACKKSEVNKNVTQALPPSHPITAGNISGFVKGTLLTGATYTVTADLTVKKGDTLAAQPGAIIIVKNDAQINVNGVLQILGSQANAVSFDSDSKQPGSWGGFACDSAQAVTIKWAHVNNTGGPDPSGDARKSV